MAQGGGIAGALTKSYGPLPGWAWAGVAALGAWLVLPHLRGASSGTAPGATKGSDVSSGYSLGYAQGVQAAGPPPSSTAPPATPPALNWHFGAPTSQNWVWRLTPSGTASWMQNTGSAPNFSLQPANSPPPSWLPQYSYQVAELPEGHTISDYLAAGLGGGIGGPGAKGSLSDWLFSGHHPMISVAHRYPHFVRAVGGAPNHTREVHRVAIQSGVHPARLMMMNPNPTGWIKVA